MDKRQPPRVILGRIVAGAIVAGAVVAALCDSPYWLAFALVFAPAFLA